MRITVISHPNPMCLCVNHSRGSQTLCAYVLNLRGSATSRGLQTLCAYVLNLRGSATSRGSQTLCAYVLTIRGSATSRGNYHAKVYHIET
jgi:hypothetical protein